MDKFEDTIVNPNISLNNFEVKVRDDVKKNIEATRSVPGNVKNKDRNYLKSIVLLLLLAAILVYQLTISF